MIYPNNYEAKVGFDEIRTMLKGRCLSELGVECVDEMRVLTDGDEIRERLEQIREMRVMLSGEDDFPAENFIDIRKALMRIRLEGTHLEEMEVFDLKRSLSTIADIVSFLSRDAEEDGSGAAYPALLRLVEGMELFPDIVARADAILNKYGRISDNASPELARIRSEIESARRGLSHSLRNIITSAQKEGVLDKDVAPTIRDGRLVIPVQPALKRKIRGIIHDESATGKTVFIEPAEVVESNNRIRELQSAEEREILRILKEFTDYVRPRIDNVLPCYYFMGEIDFIRAKALLAETMHAVEPNVSDTPTIDWVEAVHPLLAQQLARRGGKAVPLDVELTPVRRILLISGPNAGGKSVCLKTIGLLQYMLQCGMSVPMRENSRTGVFEGMFIDIGDEQSITNELSTYSSHLLNMKYMMKNAGPRTLLLIDEFGGGTEPQIGGALSEAILKRFIASGTYGVITTHYQNLKRYADGHTGVVNGAMLYDREKMQALFRLQIGQPGSSFAVEIARKIGIPQDVIDDATQIVGQDYVDSDKYLLDIVRDKRYWENKRQKVHQQEKRLEEIIAKYEKEMQELQTTRRDVMAKAKEDAQQLLDASNAKIENTIRSIREMQAEKARTREVRSELEDFKREVAEINADDKEDAIARKMEQIRRRRERREERRKQIAAAPAAGGGKPAAAAAPRSAEADRPKVGDYVRIKGQTSVGRLKDISGKKAAVVFGTMQVMIDYQRLVKAPAPERKAPAPPAYVTRSTREAVEERKLNFKPDIDVRGMRSDEAIRAVSSFIDDAVMLGVTRVRILHGTGTGALREVIRLYLGTLPGNVKFRDEHIQFGGSGITVVDLN